MLLRCKLNTCLLPAEGILALKFCTFCSPPIIRIFQWKYGLSEALYGYARQNRLSENTDEWGLSRWYSLVRRNDHKGNTKRCKVHHITCYNYPWVPHFIPFRSMVSCFWVTGYFEKVHQMTLNTKRSKVPHIPITTTHSDQVSLNFTLRRVPNFNPISL